jgi:O-antigen ligase/tetratricopeptide (TPR) repeat protein
LRTGLEPCSKASPGLARVAAWLVLLVTGLYLLTTGGNQVLVREVSAKIVLQILAIGVLGVWLAGAILRPSWRPSTPLAIPVFAVSAALALSAVLSQRPRLSLEPTLGGLGFAFGFLLLTKLLADPWFRVRVGAALKVTVAVVAFGYVVQVLVEWISWWNLIGTISVPPLRPSWARLLFGSPNNIPALLAVSGPLAIVMLHHQTRRTWMPWTLGFAVLLAVFLAGSRAAYLGTAVALLVLLGILLRGGRLRTLRARAVRSHRQRLAWLLLVGMLVLLGAALWPALVSRSAQGGDEIRFDLWRSALTVFSEHPITGGGLGTWVQLKILANPPDTPNNIFSDAHNAYVQAAAELGVVGVLSLGYLALAVVRRLVAASRSGGRLGVQSSAVTIGLSAFATQCIFANLVSLPFMTFLVAVVVAWVDSGLPDASRSVTPSELTGSKAIGGRAMPAIGLAALVVAGLAFVTIDRAALEDAAGNDAAWNQDWAAALEHYEVARQLDPGFTLYELRSASALARLGRIQEARDLLARAVAKDPMALNVIGLAALDAALGDTPMALEGARRAVALAPGDSTVALNAGLIAEAAGDADFAIDQFADAVAGAPPLAGAGLWVAPTRITAKDVVIAAAVQRSTELEGALILAYAGRPGEAVAILEQLPSSNVRETYLAAVMWLDANPDGAMARLRTRLREDPLDWFAAAWMSRIARLAGDHAAAARYGTWSLTVQGDRARGVIGERAAVPPEFDAAVAGLPPAYPSGTYLRETGAFLLMPQLTLVGYR